MGRADESEKIKGAEASGDSFGMKEVNTWKMKQRESKTNTGAREIATGQQRKISHGTHRRLMAPHSSLSAVTADSVH